MNSNKTLRAQVLVVFLSKIFRKSITFRKRDGDGHFLPYCFNGYFYQIVIKDMHKFNVSLLEKCPNAEFL